MQARVTPAPDHDPDAPPLEPVISGAPDRYAPARLFTPFRVVALVLLAGAALLLALPGPDATLAAMVVFGILMGTFAFICGAAGAEDGPAGYAIATLVVGMPLITFTAVFLGEAAKAGVHRVFPQAPENTGGALLLALVALAVLVLGHLLRHRSVIDLLEAVGAPPRSPDTRRDLYPYLPPRGGRPAVLWPETPYLVLLQHATDHVAEAARVLTGAGEPRQALALMRAQEWKTVRDVHRWRVDGTRRPTPGVSPAWLARVSTLIRLGALAEEAAHDPDRFAATYLDEATALARTLRRESAVPPGGTPLGPPPAPVTLAPEHAEPDGAAPRPGHG
ncbi:hypothetical protein [Nocardiopsis protaetiae]|uniref:hypothetical protein n=1 Tax=Nocardiopsis protaetiae TaxID=3382270 RepID=UPI00387AF8B3